MLRTIAFDYYKIISIKLNSSVAATALGKGRDARKAKGAQIKGITLAKVQYPDRSRAIAYLEGIIAGPTGKPVIAAIGRDDIIPKATKDHVITSSARKNIIARRADLRDGPCEITAKHYMALAGVIGPVRVGAMCPDDQIGKAIAVHIARRAD